MLRQVGWIEWGSANGRDEAIDALNRDGQEGSQSGETQELLVNRATTGAWSGHTGRCPLEEDPEVDQDDAQAHEEQAQLGVTRTGASTQGVAQPIARLDSEAGAMLLSSFRNGAIELADHGVGQLLGTMQSATPLGVSADNIDGDFLVPVFGGTNLVAGRIAPTSFQERTQSLPPNRHRQDRCERLELEEPEHLDVEELAVEEESFRLDFERIEPIEQSRNDDRERFAFVDVCEREGYPLVVTDDVRRGVAVEVGSAGLGLTATNLVWIFERLPVIGDTRQIYRDALATISDRKSVV